MADEPWKDFGGTAVEEKPWETFSKPDIPTDFLNSSGGSNEFASSLTKAGPGGGTTVKPSPNKAGQIIENAATGLGETADSLLPKTAGGVAQLLSPIFGAVEPIKQAYGTAKDVLGGKSIEDAVKANDPEVAVWEAMEKSPAFSKERFKEGFKMLANVGMLAAGGEGLVRAKPTVMETITGERPIEPVMAKADELLHETKSESPTPENLGTGGSEILGESTRTAPETPIESTKPQPESAGVNETAQRVDEILKSTPGTDVLKGSLNIAREQLSAAKEKAANNPELQKTVDEAESKLQKIHQQILDSQPSVQDLKPALKTDSGIIEGEKGQEHKDIYDAQDDPTALRAQDPEHGFTDQNGKFYTREEAGKLLGEDKPLQSERLKELQNENKQEVQESQTEGKTESQAPISGQAQAEGSGSGSVTGVAQRVNEARTKAGKQGEVLPGKGNSPETLLKQGREDIANDPALPEAILKKVDNGEAVSGREMGALRAQHEKLSQATDAAEEFNRKNPTPENKQAYEKAFAEETDFARQIKPAATEASETFRALQGETDIKTGAFSELRRVFNEEKGRDIKPSEQPKLKKLSEKVQKAGKEADAAQSKFNEVVKNESKGAKLKTLEDMQKHFAEKVKSMLPC